MILAGDIGGTKSNLALFRSDGGTYRKIFDLRFESRESPTFDEIISEFLSKARANLKEARTEKIVAAGFGVAGPVIDHRVKATNLPWVVDGPMLAKQLETKYVVLLNDLEATGYSVPLLGPSDLAVLNQGVPAPSATQAVVAAGTGLGEAILFWDGNRHRVAASEGGHADFAPRTDREIELLRYMKRRYEFVSVELILSGRGFQTIHSFLDPSVIHSTFSAEDSDAAAPEITGRALEGKCSVCVQTLDLWVSMYGAEAGNLALKVLARGGVWIAGGIAPKIQKKMADGAFFRAFCEKEKFGALLSQIPIRMVLNEDAPLIGAMSQAVAAAGIATGIGKG